MFFLSSCTHKQQATSRREREREREFGGDLTKGEGSSTWRRGGCCRWSSCSRSLAVDFFGEWGATGVDGEDSCSPLLAEAVWRMSSSGYREGAAASSVVHRHASLAAAAAGGAAGDRGKGKCQAQGDREQELGFNPFDIFTSRPFSFLLLLQVGLFFLHFSPFFPLSLCSSPSVYRCISSSSKMRRVCAFSHLTAKEKLQCNFCHILQVFV